MTQVPPFAPGCFGSALTFKGDDVACSGCIFRDQCEPAHKIALEELRTRLSITAPVTRTDAQAEQAAYKRAEREALIARDPEVMSLPVKVQDLVLRLDRGNFQIREKLAQGENPFVHRIPFMAIVAHLLLRMREPVDRHIISTCFVQKLNWQQGTADAHARMAIQLLTHIGAVDNMDGRISLRRAQ